MRYVLSLLTGTILLTAATAHAAGAGPIKVEVEGIEGHNQPIEHAYARCKPSSDGKSMDGENLRPAISWRNAPKGTKSFAVFMMDPDVPASFDDAGKEGKVIAADAKRQDFFHYGVINIPPSATRLNGGHADNTPVGKELVNDMGLNKYVTPATAYGGPCPPWNDLRKHHYHFTIFALDTETLTPEKWERTAESKPSDDPNTAKNTYERLNKSKNVIAKGKMVGTYTLNKEVK